MKIHLASISTQFSSILKHKIPYVLETFYYLNQNKGKVATQIKENIHKFDSFLLDSGAFTFMNNSKKSEINFDKYVENYANFINQYDVKYFFELDIDTVVGYKEVKRLRNKLEHLTNKQCIPVWHRSRGKDDWLDTIKNYNYVAVGGIVTKEIRKKEYYIFNWLLNTAKFENTKVHGLGFTSLKLLNKYPFYSVDSTNWTYGARFNVMFDFNYPNLKMINLNNQKRKVHHNIIHDYNCKQWGKFINYAKNNL